MSNLHLKLFFVLVLVLTLSQSPTTNATGTELIQNTCKKTTYNKLCVRYLETNKESYNADVAGLARIILEKALSTAKNLWSQTSDMLKKTTNEYKLKSVCFNTCHEQYGDTVDKIMVAIQAVEAHDYNLAKLYAGYGSNAAKICQEEFEKINQKSPLFKRNKNLIRLSTIAVELVSLL
ncbi:cell wall / vacuolar inhibitor of fructosidase 2-like [Magnolia sinica]|uniref:cell wall / vacuolar inhibitor of fructosidase 2-like n=1 Tax=Magnolia sinica TaxID=86752 RepID=UPI00265B60F8|nr:cell wall / vacuolar inhibitor of fructosidase 2-like [Magnolia sinica]